MKYMLWILAVAAAALNTSQVAAQNIETATVASRVLERKSKLPGEFQPYEAVDLRARVPGFVEKVLVDRGSLVKKGDLLVELDAPEMRAQTAEAQAKVKVFESQRAELDAKRVAAQQTYDRTKAASATPGAIAENELIQAGQALEAARAALKAVESSIDAANAAVKPLDELVGYLRVTAPFDGVITQRSAHPGTLAGPSYDPLLRLENIARLRLVVAVPEADVGGIVKGAAVPFIVPAFPGQTFAGTVARISHSLDAKTRTMAVELEVDNARGSLAPGMFPEVTWPSRNQKASLLVPPSAVVTTTERVFVIRVTDGKAEWVDVRKGSPSGDLVEILGGLKEGDRVVRRASDEIRNGAALK